MADVLVGLIILLGGGYVCLALSYNPTVTDESVITEWLDKWFWWAVMGYLMVSYPVVIWMVSTPEGEVGPLGVLAVGLFPLLFGFVVIVPTLVVLEFTLTVIKRAKMEFGFQ